MRPPTLSCRTIPVIARPGIAGHPDLAWHAERAAQAWHHAGIRPLIPAPMQALVIIGAPPGMDPDDPDMDPMASLAIADPGHTVAWMETMDIDTYADPRETAWTFCARLARYATDGQRMIRLWQARQADTLGYRNPTPPSLADRRIIRALAYAGQQGLATLQNHRPPAPPGIPPPGTPPAPPAR